jgi:hypothetical protein
LKQNERGAEGINMDNLEWRWRDISASSIPNGARVVLRMADAKDDISYALAVMFDGQLTYTAREKDEANLPVQWMALPK